MSNIQVVEDNGAENIKHYVDILLKLEKMEQESLRSDSYSKLITKVFNRLNSELDRAKGKRVVVDLANLPKGLNVDEWLGYLNDFNVLFTDSRKDESEIKISKQIEYIIPEMYRVKDYAGHTTYIVPQTKQVPSRYWGMIAQNRTIKWNEE